VFPYILHGPGGDRSLLEVIPCPSPDEGHKEHFDVVDCVVTEKAGTNTVPVTIRKVNLQRAHDLCITGLGIPPSHTDPTSPSIERTEETQTTTPLRGMRCGHRQPSFLTISQWATQFGVCPQCRAQVPWHHLRLDTHTDTSRLLRNLLIEGRTPISRKKLMGAVESLECSVGALAVVVEVLKKAAAPPPPAWRVFIEKNAPALPLSLLRAFRFLSEGTQLGTLEHGTVVEMEEEGELNTSPLCFEVGVGYLERNPVLPHILRRRPVGSQSLSESQPMDPSNFVIVLAGEWEIDALLGRVFVLTTEE